MSAAAATDPELAKDLRSRAVPGVGFANSKDDADALKEVVGRRDMIKANADKAIAMIKKNGTYEAFGPHNAVLNGLADQIATDQAKLIDPNSVARPGEVELVKKSLIEAGLGTMNRTAEQQLKAFLSTVDSRANQAFAKRGMKAPAMPTGESDIKVVNGVKYMRGPDGKAVRVK